MKTNSIRKSFTIQKILKIDFQNFCISEMLLNVYHEHLSAVYTIKLLWNTYFMKCSERNISQYILALKQSGFCTTYSFEILVLERKYKSNLKNRESQKMYFTIAIHIHCFCNVLLPKCRGLTKTLKVKICIFKIFTPFTEREYWTCHYRSC